MKIWVINIFTSYEEEISTKVLVFKTKQQALNYKKDFEIEWESAIKRWDKPVKINTINRYYIADNEFYPAEQANLEIHEFNI